MNTFVVDEQAVVIPSSVVDHPSFRRWIQSEDFPESGCVCYFNGGVWVDMSKEQVFSHNQVKNEYAFVLTGLSKAGKRGRYFPDGMLLSNDEADLTTQPDGLFVSKESFQSGRVRLVEGAEEGYVELEGSADMVLEVVSASSVEKDKEILLELYWAAGVHEYWLVDVRRQQLLFDIYRRGPKGFVSTRKQGGWLKSDVFGKSFRLMRGEDDEGHPDFTLEMR